jgi:2-dehydro-3-deoxyglucarate aldolase/4-hydroxy-2-oxoheptanedioate aldolase
MVMEFGSRGLAKILAGTGVDFVIVDMEHSGFDTERIADLMAWFKATEIAPFVRVPQGFYHFIARTLDAGALGIMVANVETAEQAKVIVNAAKYAPMGNRGVGLGTAHNDYERPDPEAYFTYANRNTTVICQIESTIGLKNLDAIAATPGVDVLWVGHYDLSQSMGIPGKFDHPEFRAALQSVVEATRRYDKLAGIQPGDREQAETWLRAGFQILSWTTDIALYRAALQRDITDLKKLTASAHTLDCQPGLPR